MPNVSVYLSDDEKDYVDEHIQNFSDFCRKKVREKKEVEIVEKKIKIAEKKRERKQMQHIFLVNLFFFIVGVAVLLFTISNMSNTFFTQTELIALLVLGLVLMIVYFNRLLDMNIKKLKKVKE